MIKTDITCPNCFAGYRRIERISRKGQAGQFKCLVCGRLFENFDGSTEIAYRMSDSSP
jgi:transposase-like protein